MNCDCCINDILYYDARITIFKRIVGWIVHYTCLYIRYALSVAGPVYVYAVRATNYLMQWFIQTTASHTTTRWRIVQLN